MSPLSHKLLDWIRLPESRAITNLDDPIATILHGQIIRRKYFLSELYRDFYRRLEGGLGARRPDSVLVELGSGSGFIKEVIPSVVTSDILHVPHIDLRFSGERMPFRDQSIDAFLMINVFHHIKRPRDFLREIERSLKPGGRILMIEPANTAWSRFVNTHFHHETFDATSGWEIEGEGPLSDANVALPWIVFGRDREIFAREFPSLRLTAFEPHTPLKYLFSGGLSARQLLPGRAYPMVSGLEWLLRPANPWIGMFYYVAVVKD